MFSFKVSTNTQIHCKNWASKSLFIMGAASILSKKIVINWHPRSHVGSCEPHPIPRWALSLHKPADNSGYGYKLIRTIAFSSDTPQVGLIRAHLLEGMFHPHHQNNKAQYEA